MKKKGSGSDKKHIRVKNEYDTSVPIQVVEVSNMAWETANINNFPLIKTGNETISASDKTLTFPKGVFVRPLLPAQVYTENLIN